MNAIEKIEAQQKAENAHADTVRALEEQLEENRKALLLANPSAVAFEVKFNNAQEIMDALLLDLNQVKEENPELGKGCVAAVRAFLTNCLERLGE